MHELFNTHSEACVMSSSTQHCELSHGKTWLKYRQLFTSGRWLDYKARKK
jgi:hypothetical protein